jgi:excisionase family DNA binding protein
MNDDEVFDLPGAAKYLGVPTLQLKTLAKSGRVTYCRVDRLHWRFAKRDLDAFLERRTYRAKTVFES